MHLNCHVQVSPDRLVPVLRQSPCACCQRSWSSISRVRHTRTAGRLPPSTISTPLAFMCASICLRISFTGGTSTGAHIAKTTAPLFKKLSLELGGKNPAIIFADCNYDNMLKTVMRSSFANQGQICLCGSRIFVERSIYEKFKKEAQ